MKITGRRAALLAVGDELISGEIADKNSSFLAQRLGEKGWQVHEMRLVGDDEEEIAAAVSGLAQEAGLVLVCGGLGPTLDDVTRQGVARAAGLELVLDAEVSRGISEWFLKRKKSTPNSNERQAYFPQGAVVLPNGAGTAPGFRLNITGAEVAVLPGPPPELQHIYEDQVSPWLEELAPGSEVVRRRALHLFGLGESAFADRVGDWMQRDANPRMGVTANCGVLSVKLRAVATTSEEAEALLEARALDLREEFQRHLFSEEDPDPSRAAGLSLLETGTSVAIAESCTGGMVAEKLTRIPGISEVLLEGFVTYSNQAKIQSLGVPPELIEQHGAVSEQVALAMARGAARVTGAALAVSTTGIAGPDGGSEEKPVGTVCFGLWQAEGERCLTKHFPPRGRQLVRLWSANTALDLLRRGARGLE